MRYPISFFFLFLFLSGPVCLATDVTVEVHDENGKLLSNAVVWAVPKVGPVRAARNATAVMDQKNRMFIPHVLPVQVGTAVTFPNSDNVRHQVYSFSPPKTFQLPLYIGTPTNPVIFDKPGVVSLGCNIHDQMSAFVVVVPTPHFGTSGKDGRVKLEDIGYGELVVHVWHPEMARPFQPVSLTLRGKPNRELAFVIRKR